MPHSLEGPVFLLHVGETMFIFLIMQNHLATQLGLEQGSQLLPCMITKEVSLELTQGSYAWRPLLGEREMDSGGQ